VVAAEAFVARGKTPGLQTLSAWCLWIGDLERTVLSGSLDQRGIGLLFVPFVGVAAPFATVVVQSLRLDSPPACRVAGHQVDRQGFQQHRVPRIFGRP